MVAGHKRPTPAMIKSALVLLQLLGNLATSGALEYRKEKWAFGGARVGVYELDAAEENKLTNIHDGNAKVEERSLMIARKIVETGEATEEGIKNLREQAFFVLNLVTLHERFKE